MTKCNSIVLAFLMVIISGALRCAPAQTKAVPIMYSYALSGSYGFEICVGSTRGVLVGMLVRRALKPPRGRRPVWGATHVPTGVLIDGAVTSGGGVGDLTPSSARTGVIGLADFDFTARQRGTATLTFISPPGALTGPTGQPVSVTPYSLQVTVEPSCKWLVEVQSDWVSSGPGFFRKLTSTFQATLDLSSVWAGSPLDSTARVVNVAVGVPVGGCVPRFDTPATEATIHVSRSGMNGQAYMLSLFYEPVHATTHITCPGGAGMQVDVGEPLATPLLNLRFPLAGGGIRKPHLLKTRPRDLPGHTTVIVTPIP